MSDLNPNRINQIGMAFMASRTLLTAVQFDIFTILNERPLTGEEIRIKLDLHPRAIPDFTDALVALQFLTRDGDGPSALYENTPESSAFLNRNSPRYNAGFLNLCGQRLYGIWNNLPDALQTGKQQNESETGSEMFDTLYQSEEIPELFSQAMLGFNTAAHAKFAREFNFDGYKTLLDLGGASAQFSCEVVKANDNIHCISFDLPPVLVEAEKTVRRNGLSERITCVAGDYFKDDIVNADIIVMGMILHDNNLERKKYLMRKAYNALPDGGAFVAIDMLIDDARREREDALLMSLNMMLEFGDAKDYSSKEFEEWSLDIGFKRIEVIELEDGRYAAIAYK